jgi:hypothetical protein
MELLGIEEKGAVIAEKFNNRVAVTETIQVGHNNRRYPRFMPIHIESKEEKEDPKYCHHWCFWSLLPSKKYS